MTITNLPSPNYDSRDEHIIDMLVLHYTGMPTAEDAKTRLCDPQAKVSAHYVVDEDGAVYALVAEEHRAWHAGVSAWRGHSNINQRSIGIEIVNPGHEFGYRPFPKAQMEAITSLCKDILSRHPIPPRNVVAHSDIAPTRKEDPGELFDWKGLGENGIGLWPNVHFAKGGFLNACFLVLGLLMRCTTDNSWLFRGTTDITIPSKKTKTMYTVATGTLPSPDQLQPQLAAYGYDTTDLAKTILAFQRHFFSTRLTGVWDHECGLRLATLLTML